MGLTWEFVDKNKKYAFIDDDSVKTKFRNKSGKFTKIYTGSLPIHPFAEFKLEDGSFVEIKTHDIGKLTEVQNS